KKFYLGNRFVYFGSPAVGLGVDDAFSREQRDVDFEVECQVVAGLFGGGCAVVIFWNEIDQENLFYRVLGREERKRSVGECWVPGFQILAECRVEGFEGVVFASPQVIVEKAEDLSLFVELEVESMARFSGMFQVNQTAHRFSVRKVGLFQFSK